MNYLNTKEYGDGKELLTGEYKESYQLIEGYYIIAYTKGSYEVQVSLNRILDDFLQAQKKGIALKELIRNDLREYSIQMIQVELDLEKSKSRYVKTAIVGVWCILMIMFAKAIFNYQGLSIFEKMNHIYFSYIEALYIFGLFLFVLVMNRIYSVLFYHQKLLTNLKFILSIILAYLIIYYLEKFNGEESNFAIWVPAQLFIAFGVIFLFGSIVLSYISNKKVRAKKKKLIQSEGCDQGLTPAQIICPSCRNKHDYDYPKCPFCGHNYELYNKSDND